VKVFVQSRAPDGELKTLVDLRDGTVHAAQTEELEERLVVAFVLHADAFLADLGRDRSAFWRGRLGVVDALLAEAADKTARAVAVRIAGARAEFARSYGDAPAEVLQVVRQIAAASRLDRDEWQKDCPACGSVAVVGGDPEVDWDYEIDMQGRYRATRGKVWFNALALACHGSQRHGIRMQITERLATPVELPSGGTVHIATQRWALERCHGEADPPDLKQIWARKPKFAVNGSRSCPSWPSWTTYAATAGTASGCLRSALRSCDLAGSPRLPSGQSLRLARRFGRLPSSRASGLRMAGSSATSWMSLPGGSRTKSVSLRLRSVRIVSAKRSADSSREHCVSAS
jgi:hypothetical protein